MERAKWAAVGLVCCSLVFGAIFAQYFVINHSGEQPPVAVGDWLPTPPAQEGPIIRSFEEPFTPSGLRAAAVTQFRTAMALTSVKGYDLWFQNTCAYWYLGPPFYSAGAHFSDLTLRDVSIAEFSADHSLVLLDLEFRPNPALNVNPEHPYAETWTYRDGRWKNETCGYNLGPTLADILRANPSTLPAIGTIVSGRPTK